jgi:hypothetical protein
VRTEITYGVRPRRGVTPLSLLEAVNNEPAVENAELFDTRNQVEF